MAARENGRSSFLFFGFFSSWSFGVLEGVMSFGMDVEGYCSTRTMRKLRQA